MGAAGYSLAATVGEGAGQLGAAVGCVFEVDIGGDLEVAARPDGDAARVILEGDGAAVGAEQKAEPAGAGEGGVEAAGGVVWKALPWREFGPVHRERFEVEGSFFEIEGLHDPLAGEQGTGGVGGVGGFGGGRRRSGLGEEWGREGCEQEADNG